jgi:hypothetical protein
MSIQVLDQVGPQIATDGQVATPRLGKTGETVITQVHGKAYEGVARGFTFIGSTAMAGVAIPISSTTSPTFGLWNPTGSGKNAVLIRFQIGWVGTTGAAGNIGFAYAGSAGNTIATGGVISAFNQGTALNANLGGGSVSVMKFTPAGTNTLTTAGTFLQTCGLSQLTTSGSATSVCMWTASQDYDGSIIVPPGVFLYVVATNPLLSLFTLSLTWEETPV